MEIFYTDGAKNKDGAGAAFVQLTELLMLVETREIPLPDDTTSQQAELEAVIAALRESRMDGVVEIKTDSQYIAKGYTGEYDLKANEELWDALFQEAAQRREVTITHIPRRSDAFAKRVDNAAQRASRLDKPTPTVYTQGEGENNPA